MIDLDNPQPIVPKENSHFEYHEMQRQIREARRLEREARREAAHYQAMEQYRQCQEQAAKRHELAMKIAEIAQEKAEAAAERIIDMMDDEDATATNMKAAEFIIARATERQGGTFLNDVLNLDGLNCEEALGAVIEAAASGQISLEQAEGLAKLIKMKSDATDVSSLVSRMAELEQVIATKVIPGTTRQG